MSHGYADLHLHTNRSDGYFSPQELIDKVLPHGLKAIAIADHDEISAIDEAMKYGKVKGIEVISGVELSVSYKGMDLHILGYCFDHNNSELVQYLSLFKNERIKRAEKIVHNLMNLGMPISFDSVLKKAGIGSVGRPHIANVLVEDGYVYSFQEAFDKFLGNGKPAHVNKYKIDVEEAFKIVKAAGGICSIAHPALDLTDNDLISIIKAGVDAIEIVHPRHNEEMQGHLTNLAESNGLLITGGSDFHGGTQGEDALGKYRVPYNVLAKIKERTNR